MRSLFQAWHRQYSDLPQGAVVLHDPGQQQYSDLPPGATVIHAPAEKQGFFSSLGENLGINAIIDGAKHPQSGADNMKERAQYQHDHPVRSFLMGQPGDSIIDGAYGAVKRSAGELAQGVQALRDGNPWDAVSHTVSAVPIAGPAIQKAVNQSDPSTGNYIHDVANVVTNPGAMGTLTGAAIQLAPLVPERLARPILRRGGGGGGGGGGTSGGGGGGGDWIYRTIGGDKLDLPIKGDTVTPRELYQTAKDMGVNLDSAQATGSPIATGAKRVTEHSLGGASKFEANNAANTNALYAHAENILDQAHPQNLSREQFGNAAKDALLKDQQAQYDAAGKIYQDLSDRNGVKQPDAAGIRDMAKIIQNANDTYYQAHPELLRGGAGSAWKIVNDLAGSEPAPPKVVTSPILDETGKAYTSEKPAPVAHVDTWNDLQKLRTDLLDQIRQPELVGTRAEGWLKQLTGKIDEAMTNPETSGLQGEDLQKFKDANAIWKRMKNDYDDVSSKLYHVVRAADGTQAANHLTNVSPQLVRQLQQAAPELIAPLRRQTMSRIISPAGNEIPELSTLPNRFLKAQKENLRGVLTPEQVQQLEDLVRVTRNVNFDSNTSGTAKVLQKTNELGSIGTGVSFAGKELTEGRPIRGLVGGASRTAAVAIKRPIAAVLTKPAFTDAVMNATKGRPGWINAGESKLSSHVAADSTSGITVGDVARLRGTAKGQQILVKASSLTPGSAMMRSIAKQAKALIDP